MKVAHLIIGGEVAGGQIVCGQIMDALRTRGHEAIVISPTEGEFTNRVKKQNIPVHLMPFGKSYDIRDSWRMARLLRNEHVDLLHTHVLMAMHVQARIGARMAGVPVVSHLHIANHFSSHGPIRTYQAFADNQTSRSCRDLIAVSEATKDQFVSQGIPCNRVDVIYNGIDVTRVVASRSREDVCREFDLDSSVSQLIGVVGRLCPVKGQREFLAAARGVLDRFPNASFLIIGKDIEKGGAYEAELKSFADELELGSRVIFTGYRCDVVDLVSALDVFVLPSKVEGLPLVLLEAMALKKPLVATSVGGVPELVDHGRSGFLVAAGDVEGLSEAINHLLDEPVMAKQLGEAGHERVANKFSEQEMLERILGLYNLNIVEKSLA